MKPKVYFISTLAILGGLCFQAAVYSQHEHGATEDTTPKAPTIFLDKSPRIVAYQLSRLTNDQLLLIPTATDDAKYIPVFTAILSRVGMSPAAREDALAGLVAINKSSPVDELSLAMQGIKGSDEDASRTIEGLASLLMQQPEDALKVSQKSLVALCESQNSVLASVGCAALATAGLGEVAKSVVGENLVPWLQGIPRISDAETRNYLHAEVLNVALSDSNPAVRQAAIEALGAMTAHQSESFAALTKLVQLDELRVAALKSLLRVPVADRGADMSAELTAWLVDYAESTPAAQRTEDSFLDAMQLVDQLLAASPGEAARSYRARLRETIVRVVRIHTVEEEMRYDIPYFAVETGRPVQIVLVNEDLMPHNLVITKPGALQEVAQLGFEAGTENGMDGKQYVPKSDLVLFATNMIAARETERLTFTAPEEPGEYPYVCTFPRHWMRMYGVMVVVDDLDKWNQSPTKPVDPIGSNRSFVQKWTVSDLADELEVGLKGRSPEIGQKLFTEATCAGCHHAGELKIGSVGPELNTLYKRQKSDRKAILREILEPSHRIDDKYAVQLILTVDGDTISGLVVKESKDTIFILENPEAKEATEVAVEDIEQRVKTANSMMPKGLLDQYSKDEIFEIMAFIESVQQE